MRSDFKKSTRSVKLYPRVATPKRTRVHPPHRAVDRVLSDPVAGDATVDVQRVQMRARLLRMILENEETRRNDRRPNAS